MELEPVKLLRCRISEKAVNGFTQLLFQTAGSNKKARLDFDYSPVLKQFDPRGIFRTPSNMYNGAFMKIVNS